MPSAVSVIRRLLLSLAFGVCVTASPPASAYALGDIVQAVERGLPSSVIQQMVEQSRDEWSIDDETAAQLLRSGIPHSLLRLMSKGTQPTSEALALAALDGQAIQSSDVAGRALVASVAAEDARLAAENPLDGPMYIDGHTYWVYAADDFTMRVMVRDDEQHTAVMVSFTNTGSERLNLFPEQVSLFRMRGAEGIALERIPADVYITRMENRTVLLGTLQGLAIAGTIYGVSGGQGDIGDVTRAHRYTSGKVQATMQRGREESAYADSILLRANTVHPGQTVAGMVPFRHNPYAGERFTVRIDLGHSVAVLPGQVRR